MNPINRNLAVVSHSSKAKHVAILGADGSVPLRFPIDRALTLQHLPGGHFLVQQALQVVEFDLTGKVFWRYCISDDPNDCSLERRAEKGNELMGAWRLPSGNTLIGDFRCGGFYELTPDFQVVNRFDYPYATLGDRHFWWRAFRVLGNGNLLIGGYEHGKVIELTQTGKVVWEAQVDGNPYEAIRTKNGNTLVSLGPSGKIVELDPSGMPVWQVDTAALWEPRWDPWISGIAELDNGNILYADYYNSTIFELERPGKLVGQIYDRTLFRNPASILVL